MNKGNYLEQKSYPVSSETFDFMQNLITFVANLSKLGGNNYILSGCEKVGNNYNAGLIVLNGELFEFIASAASTVGNVDYIYISETTESAQVYNVLYSNIRTLRKVTCGRGLGETDIKQLKRITNLLDIKTAIDSLNTAVNGKAALNHSHTQITNHENRLQLLEADTLLEAAVIEYVGTESMKYTKVGGVMKYTDPSNFQAFYSNFLNIMCIQIGNMGGNQIGEYFRVECVDLSHPVERVKYNVSYPNDNTFNIFIQPIVTGITVDINNIKLLVKIYKSDVICTEFNQKS